VLRAFRNPYAHGIIYERLTASIMQRILSASDVPRFMIVAASERTTPRRGTYPPTTHGYCPILYDRCNANALIEVR